MKKLLLTLVVLLVGGCVTLSSSEQAASLDDNSLCLRAFAPLRGGIYGHTPDAIARAEISRRGLIKDAEWTLIDQQKIRVGMSECGLLASWGRPSTINSSVGSFGKSKQYVYRGYFASGTNYVYVKNGVVEAFQN